MSIRLMTAVWQLDLPATDKMVLLALADAANDDGVTWIPLKSRTEGKSDLTIKCSLSKRAIQLALRRLEMDKYLHRTERPGRGVIYVVHPDGGAPDAPVHQMHPASDAPAGERGAPKPSIPVKTEAKASCDRAQAAWNEMRKGTDIPASRILDASLRQSIRLRVKENGEAAVMEAIAAVKFMPWLRGEGRDSKWRPTLGWLMTPANFRKVLEGSYGAAEAQAERLTDAEKIRLYEERAAWFRQYDRDTDAERCLAVAARLRAAQVSEHNRRLVGDVGARPIGEMVSRVTGSLSPQ